MELTNDHASPETPRAKGSGEYLGGEHGYFLSKWGPGLSSSEGKD